MRVAIIHYWLVGIRGGEKVLEAICELYPDADIYTHVYDESEFKNSIISKHKIYTTLISRLPLARIFYQAYLPLMPLALEELDLSQYDLVISSESGPAKGVIPPIGIPHVCYCHSPMRYAWDMYHDYKSNSGFLKRLLMPLLMHYLRRWDQLSSTQVTQFVANSKFVAKRISSYYQRSSIVVHPPVDFQSFNVSDDVEDYFLLLGQLVPYKRADLAISAFAKSGRKLVVVGEGEQIKILKKNAPDNITFLGRQPFEEIKKLMSRCQALIFPGVEDFGIVPIEVMASGRPVIAYAKGGALETVVDNFSGLYFYEQNVGSLNNAVDRFDNNSSVFDSHAIREYARIFSKSRFKKEFSKVINDICADY